MTKLSIITVVYNGVSTLEKTFESVIKQTVFKQIEYIVIDGASTDGSIDLIKKHSDHISQWYSEPDKGIYDAMNKGLSKATGDWVGFLHADDELASDTTLASILNSIETQRCNVIYGDLDYITATLPSKTIRAWKSKPFTNKLLKQGWMPAHPTLYIKTSHFKTIGLFDTRYRIAADYDFILRLFSHPSTQSFYLSEVLVKMRLGGASNKSLKNIIRKSKEDYLALKRNHIGGLRALVIKNLSKITQFFKHQQHPQN